MTARNVRRYIDELLQGRRPKPFRPDEFEAAQIRTAIELRGSRPGAEVTDAPREDFLADLHQRLTEQMSGAATDSAPQHSATRRHVIVGTSAAAAAAVAAVAIDRAVIGDRAGGPAAVAGRFTPNDGSWQRVAASAEGPDDRMRPFDLGSISGFVRRVDGKPQAVSGVCTHQGCRLWFDAPDDRLRCPCHSTSFAPTGQVLTHQLPIAPKPVSAVMVREADGFIEVFAPVRHDQSG